MMTLGIHLDVEVGIEISLWAVFRRNSSSDNEVVSSRVKILSADSRNLVTAPAFSCLGG